MYKLTLFFGTIGFVVSILATLFFSYHWTFTALSVVSGLACIAAHHKYLSDIYYNGVEYDEE